MAHYPKLTQQQHIILSDAIKNHEETIDLKMQHCRDNMQIYGNAENIKLLQAQKNDLAAAKAWLNRSQIPSLWSRILSAVKKSLSNKTLSSVNGA